MANETVITPSAQPNDPNSSHEIVFKALEKTIGLRLLRGLADITPASTRAQNIETGRGGSRFGPYGNTLTELEQRSWLGGRAWDRWEDNHEGFLDSRGMWTMVPGKVMHGPQKNFGEGYRNENRYLPIPHNVGWRPLDATTKDISQSFVPDPLAAAANYDAKKAYIYLRRKGDPKEGVTLGLYANSGGSPTGAALEEKTLTISDITDYISLWQVFTFASVETLTDGTTYHVVVTGGTNANPANCWEVGVDESVGNSKYSADGSTWAAADFSLYYRIVDADVQQKMLFFAFRGAWYAMIQRLDRVVSQLFIVGDRGTSTGSNTSTTLKDTNCGMYGAGNWPTDRWVDAYAEVVTGPGKGQVRQITASTTGGTLTIDPAWDVTPGSVEYVIHGSRWFKDISPSSGAQIDVYVESVAVGNDQVYFARGIDASYPILRMSFNGTAHVWADDGDTTNSLADILYIYTDPYGGTRLTKINNTNVDVAFSELTAIGTNLSWSEAKEVGTNIRPINSAVAHENQLWVIKSDGLFYLTSTSDQNWYEFSTQLKSLTNPNNGQDSVSFQKYLWLTYGGFSLERVIGDSIEDVGPWIRAGLPNSQKGPITCLSPIFDYLAVGVDAGASGNSTVQIRRSDGYHPLYYHDEVGQSIRNIRLQSSNAGVPWLWISVGADAAFQIMPGETFNPENDAGFYFTNEGVLTTGYYDMDAVRLSKMLRTMYVAYKNMEAGREVIVEYQVNEKVGLEGANNWTELGRCRKIEGEELLIKRGNLKRVAFRFRSQTNSATDSLHLLATILTAYTKLPDKPMYAIQATLGGTGRIHKDDYSAEFIYRSLQEMASAAVDVEVSSTLPFLNGSKVTITLVVPVARSIKTDEGRGNQDEIAWAGLVNLTIVEA